MQLENRCIFGDFSNACGQQLFCFLFLLFCQVRYSNAAQLQLRSLQRASFFFFWQRVVITLHCKYKIHTYVHTIYYIYVYTSVHLYVFKNWLSPSPRQDVDIRAAIQYTTAIIIAAVWQRRRATPGNNSRRRSHSLTVHIDESRSRDVTQIFVFIAYPQHRKKKTMSVYF